MSIKTFKGFHKDMTCRDFSMKKVKSIRRRERKHVIVVFMHVNIRWMYFHIIHRT